MTEELMAKQRARLEARQNKALDKLNAALVYLIFVAAPIMGLTYWALMIATD